MSDRGDRGRSGVPRGDGPGEASRGLRRAPASGDVIAGRQRRRSDDDEEFDENPQVADIERFSGVTRRCPECGKDVFDDSAVCYHCGHAFERTTTGSTRTPIWVIGTVLVLVLAMLFGVLTGIVRLF